MHRKIISALLAALLISGLSSCGKDDTPPEITTSTEAVTTQAPTTEATTAATTAAPTTAKPTETTKKPTTTKKKVTTTVKKVVTTIAETASEETTRRNYFADYRTEEHTDNIELKYGVYCARAVTTTYIKLEDGSEEVYDEEVTEVYTRIGYSASYEDLLPAAEENKEKYSSEISEVLEIINSYRAEGGLEPLILDDKLTTIACARAEEIAWSGKHSHYRPNNKFFSSILKDAGITKGNAGENIGWGYPAAAAVCEAWKNSETHYENIMNPEFTRIGIGVAADPDPDGKLCWSQLFIDNIE
ncbi:MAG: CAP domain-containing protein [Clostridia bacterium]|nr:CAP domain-containing protein [Clostridia bacterium]